MKVLSLSGKAIPSYKRPKPLASGRTHTGTLSAAPFSASAWAIRLRVGGRALGDGTILPLLSRLQRFMLRQRVRDDFPAGLGADKDVCRRYKRGRF